MIQINRVHEEPIIVEEAHTVKEAVKYATRNNISLKDADLRGSNLRNMNLSNADLSGAYLQYADLSHSNLSGACLRNAKLNCANLTEACLADANLSYAYLSNANLTGTVLSGTVLIRAELSDADLSGANLDYSCLPLWCGSLNMKIDKKIFCQLLYHVLRAGKSVKDEDVEAFLSDEKALALANKFHRIEECGKLKAINTTEEK